MLRLRRKPPPTNPPRNPRNRPTHAPLPIPPHALPTDSPLQQLSQRARLQEGQRRFDECMVNGILCVGAKKENTDYEKVWCKGNCERCDDGTVCGQRCCGWMGVLEGDERGERRGEIVRNYLEGDKLYKRRGLCMISGDIENLKGDVEGDARKREDLYGHENRQKMISLSSEKEPEHGIRATLSIRCMLVDGTKSYVWTILFTSGKQQLLPSHVSEPSDTKYGREYTMQRVMCTRQTD